jgi:beta-galactosidase
MVFNWNCPYIELVILYFLVVNHSIKRISKYFFFAQIRTAYIELNMKTKFFLAVLIVINAALIQGQHLDSLRQVIHSMGYELPVLSPIPVSVHGLQITNISLNGIWQFSPDNKNDKTRARNIEVPGEWAMQGFKVNPGTYATYQNNFRIPSEWNGNRIKLRCDAVYSECEIFINGQKAGGHVGGFTAFETDITAFIQSRRENSITIRVRSESIADSLSNASKYAVHPLGGISRKIFLMALPELHCSMFHVSTAFDKNFVNAVIHSEVELTNASSKNVKTGLRFELTKDGDQDVIFKKDLKIEGVVKADSISLKSFSLDVDHPLKWDPEHPNLYNLKLSVIADGKIVEVINRTFGFKQTEVRGNQVFVNNMPVKLRGVCRHEVMPLRGRSLSAGQWEEDIELFRAANVNYIRTSHYPPAPELLEACDRLGMFVEVEGPFCWAEQTRLPDKLRYPALIQPILEMVNTFRSNPSVLMWSIANESAVYQEYFSQVAKMVKIMDPTRPRNFSQYVPENDNNELEIGNCHYPGPQGPEKYADSFRPITFDEYCHLNAYNRFELVTDPGIRDAWGIGFEWMWNKMYHTNAILGGSLWAAIDDSFILPDGSTIGYGTWGPVDGWRRPKPEYWHVKKVYSPVKITQTGNRDKANGTIEFEIENRMLFTDLAECKFIWKTGNQTGNFKAKAKPRETDTVTIKIPQTEDIYLEIIDPRGIVIDQYEFKAVPGRVETKKIKDEKAIIFEDDSKIQASCGDITMVIDKTNNCMKAIQLDGKAIVSGDVALMILPLNGEGHGIQMRGDNVKFNPYTTSCKNRVVQRIEYILDNQKFMLRIFDKYNEAQGYTEYCLSNGELNISYNYEISENINPRQVGTVFSLPEDFQQLEWERIGQWSFYPDDHIGRLKGTAVAINNNPVSGPAGPVTKPGQPWSFDQNELGTNDFRSTKRNITKAILTNGVEKMIVVSDGSQSVRCWLENDKINLLVTSYSNMGAEGFFRSHASLIDRPLKPEDYISGTVRLLFSKEKM